MINSTELLPIGTIVLLKGGKKRVMLTGVKQIYENKDYDYCAVLYPEGDIGGKSKYVFNADDIFQVFFRGYEDIERQNFIVKLAAYFKSKHD